LYAGVGGGGTYAACALRGTRRTDDTRLSSPRDASDGYWPGDTIVHRPRKYAFSQTSQRPRCTMTDDARSLNPSGAKFGASPLVVIDGPRNPSPA